MDVKLCMTYEYSDREMRRVFYIRHGDCVVPVKPEADDSRLYSYYETLLFVLAELDTDTPGHYELCNDH